MIAAPPFLMQPPFSSTTAQDQQRQSERHGHRRRRTAWQIAIKHLTLSSFTRHRRTETDCSREALASTVTAGSSANIRCTPSQQHHLYHDKQSKGSMDGRRRNNDVDDDQEQNQQRNHFSIMAAAAATAHVPESRKSGLIPSLCEGMQIQPAASSSSSSSSLWQTNGNTIHAFNQEAMQRETPTTHRRRPSAIAEPERDASQRRPAISLTSLFAAPPQQQQQQTRTNKIVEDASFDDIHATSEIEYKSVDPQSQCTPLVIDKCSSACALAGAAPRTKAELNNPSITPIVAAPRAQPNRLVGLSTNSAAAAAAAKAESEAIDQREQQEVLFEVMQGTQSVLGHHDHDQRQRRRGSGGGGDSFAPSHHRNANRLPPAFTSHNRHPIALESGGQWFDTTDDENNNTAFSNRLGRSVDVVRRDLEKHIDITDEALTTDHLLLHYHNDEDLSGDQSQFWLTPSTASAAALDHPTSKTVDHMSVQSHEVGVAYTTNDEAYAAPQYNYQYEEQKKAFAPHTAHGGDNHDQSLNGVVGNSNSVPRRSITPEQHDYLATNGGGGGGVKQQHGVAKSNVASTQNEVMPAAVDPGHRVFGLSRDLAGYSPDSAYLPSPYNGLQPMAAVLQQQGVVVAAAASSSANGNPTPSSSKLSTPSLDRAMRLPSYSGSNSSSQAHLPREGTAASNAPAPAASQPASSASHFSIEVIAPSFDKRGYPIFSGRAARIRGVIRMKALRGCQVVINLGAYISQGAQAAVWDGVALMPPESGHDHKVFSIREVIELDESALQRVQLSGASADADGIFETSFDINLPLGMSTRFVNGEPTVTAVALPPSYEMSSEAARERDPSRSTAGLLKSGAASIRSKSSRITTLTTTGTQIGASVRDAVERGFGEVYRIGCFYKMEFTLQRTGDSGNGGGGGASQPRRFFGKSKTAKITTLDKITVPFIFLGEQSTEQPPPLSIPAVLIANAVAQPGLFLGDGWQCERASVKWPGRGSRHLKRNVELELHMPEPATIHAPSLFPVLIILRPEDGRLLSVVPAEAFLASPTADDGQPWSSATKGRSHSRQTSVSTQRPSGAGGGKKVTDSPSAAQMANGHGEQETLDSYDTAVPHHGGNDGGNDGMLSKFMRSSLSLSRKASYNNGLPPSRAGQSPGAQYMQAGGSAGSGGGGGGGVSHGGTEIASSAASFVGAQSSRRTGHTASLRDAVANKLRKRPSTAPPSQTSSEARSRISGSTVLGTDGQYVGALSGLVRVSLVQTTFCVASGPSELPKNIRKLISIAEVEELDSESLRQMAQPRNKRQTDSSVGGDAADENNVALQQALQDQIDGKGVRVLRALFRVGSDPTPSFRCHGIELRYGIKVDLVPFTVRQRHVNRPTSTGAASAGSGGTDGGALPRSATSSSANFVASQHASAATDSAPNTVPSTSAGLSTADGVGATPTASIMSSTVRDLSGKRSMDFSLFRGLANGGGGTSEYGGDQHVPRSGETVVSTVYADRANSYNKIEKGVGVLFANVRMVRAAV